MSETAPVYLQQKTWKRVFIVISVFILIIMPLLSRDYGQSGDEWLQIFYGQDIWNYFMHDNQQALDYTNKALQYENQQLYGGWYDFTTEMLHQWFPSIPILTLRHFINALYGAVLMIFTGLIAMRISRKWWVGVLALLLILFSPRIFGESMNNPKDIPFAATFTVAIYALLALLQDFPKRAWRNALILALGWGMTFGIRSAGGFLLLAIIVFFTVLYFVLNKPFREQMQADGNKLMKKLALIMLVAIAAGYVLGIATWPYGLQSPISNPLASLKEMTNRGVQLRVLFEGEYRMNNMMPWYYEFKWILMTNPIIVFLGMLAFIVLITRAKKQYGLFPILLMFFVAFFTILYMIYKSSSVYDTWRHVFFVYPAWIVISALGFDLVSTQIKNEKYRLVPFVVGVLGLLPAIIWTVRSHPNQYVYFNAIAGGVEGAYGYYDLDYYQNTGKQAADWVRENAPRPPKGQKLKLLSNMMGFDKYFAEDTAWITFDYGRYNDRHHLEWDYYVAYPRYVSAVQMQNDMWPPKHAVHIIEIDGVPLSAILERKSRAGIVAYEAFEKQDYATAAQKYAEYIQVNNTDENALVNYGISLAYVGNIDGAVNALNQALAIDPKRPDIYEILAQLYQAKGDMQNAQLAKSRASILMMEMQQ